MVRRSQPRWKEEEKAFPVLVRVKDLDNAYLRMKRSDAEVWLKENIGRGEFAVHGLGGQRLCGVGFYFRSVEAAMSFREAFPELELLDTTHTCQLLQEEKRSAAASLVRDQ